MPELPGWAGYFDFVQVETVARDVIDVALGGVSSLASSQTPREPVYVHHGGETVIPVQEVRSHVEKQVGEEIVVQRIADWIASASVHGMNPLVAHSLVLPCLERRGA